MLASAYAFRRIVGIEFFPKLHEVAVKNLDGYRSPEQRCFSLQSVCADALEWEPPAEPLLCFFFNPFDDTTMERVLVRLAESWRRVPRDISLLYVNIRDVREQARVFEQCRALTLVSRGQHFLHMKVTGGPESRMGETSPQHALIMGPHETMADSMEAPSGHPCGVGRVQRYTAQCPSRKQRGRRSPPPHFPNHDRGASGGGAGGSHSRPPETGA
jgi:hypothetical protein